MSLAFRKTAEELPREIRTERLRLRRWQPDDLEVFTAMSADPQVMEFFHRSKRLRKAKRVISGFLLISTNMVLDFGRSKYQDRLPLLD